MESQITSVRKAQATPIKSIVSSPRQDVTEPPRARRAAVPVPADRFKSPGGPLQAIHPDGEDTVQKLEPRKLTFLESSSSPIRRTIGEDRLKQRQERFGLRPTPTPRKVRGFQRKSLKSMLESRVGSAVAHLVTPIPNSGAVEEEATTGATTEATANDENPKDTDPKDTDLDIPVPPGLCASSSAEGFYRLKYKGLMKFYRKVNPAKATHENVERLMIMYHGDFGTLVAKLSHTYGADQASMLSKL